MALNAREPEALVRNPGEGEEAQMSGPPGQGQKIRMDLMDATLEIMALPTAGQPCV